MSEETKNPKLKEFYKRVADIEEIQKDVVRMNVGLKPESEVGSQILDEEIETNDLSRFRKFKIFVKEHFGAISGILIGIGGIITSIVVSTRSFVKKGARAVKNFGKGLAKVAEKVGPLVSSFLGLAASLLDGAAKGLSFLSDNLGLLIAFLSAYAIKNSYAKETLHHAKKVHNQVKRTQSHVKKAQKHVSEVHRHVKKKMKFFPFRE